MYVCVCVCVCVYYNIKIITRYSIILPYFNINILFTGIYLSIYLSIYQI